jgi:hypothetical protein
MRLLWARHAELAIDSAQALKIARAICTLGALQCRLAEQLALLPRHTHGRRSGVLSERYPSGGKVLPWERHV